MMNYKIIGYHGTTDFYASIILKEGFKLPKEDPNHNHWLGHGVYFYKYRFLAEYWAMTKCKAINEKCKKKKYSESVLCVDIVTKDRIIADLDDPKQLLEYNKRVNDYIRLIKESDYTIVFNSDKLKKCSDKEIRDNVNCFIHDLFATDKNLDVMIFTFKKKFPGYASQANKESLIGNNYMEQYSETQICVYNLDIIENIKLLERELEIC